MYLFIYFIPVVQGIESKKEVTVKSSLLYKATIFGLPNSPLVHWMVTIALLCYSAEELPKEGGVFVTLQNRYYSEYAALLEYVHKSDKTEPMILLALLKSEAFIVDRLGDFKISSLYVGLMERLNSVLQKR